MDKADQEEMPNDINEIDNDQELEQDSNILIESQ